MPVLAAAAEKIGLEGARAVLEDPDAYKAAVVDQLKLSRGVSGVPYFIIDDKVRLSGAQPPDVFAEAFQEILDS